MKKMMGGRPLAAAAALTAMIASPAMAERFELTYTGTLTRMQSSLGCQDVGTLVCDSQQALSPVAPISFTRSVVFEIGGPAFGQTFDYTLDPTTDWFGRPMRYEVFNQSMGDSTLGGPAHGADLPAAMLTQTGLATPGALPAPFVGSFFTREIATYLDATGGERRADMWGISEFLGWSTAEGRNVGVMFQLMQDRPAEVTQQNMSQPISVSEFIARMNQDFWCQGCTQTVLATVRNVDGLYGPYDDYLYHGTVGAFSLRQLDAAVVPEPSTYALMVAGVAAIGFVARRRRQVGTIKSAEGTTP